jgi:hypothetical protein
LFVCHVAADRAAFHIAGVQDDFSVGDGLVILVDDLSIHAEFRDLRANDDAKRADYKRQSGEQPENLFH